tara:strand:+ start:1725 stop:2159 length:435 start_codon:yes stop_codon:yes gene_type:complete
LITTNKKIYFSVTVLILTIIYFVILAFDSSTVFYYKIDELSKTNIKSTETIRVVGTLVDNSFEREKDSTTAVFSIQSEDGTNILTAHYEGVVPELFFNEQSEIVLEGKLNNKDNLNNEYFKAQNIIVKCPSKYEEVQSEKTKEL